MNRVLFLALVACAVGYVVGGLALLRSAPASPRLLIPTVVVQDGSQSQLCDYMLTWDSRTFWTTACMVNTRPFCQRASADADRQEIAWSHTSITTIPGRYWLAREDGSCHVADKPW